MFQWTVSGSPAPPIPMPPLVGLVAWYRGDTVTDTAGKASAWTDLSGNGRTLTQATSSHQPVIVAAALNGQQVLRFATDQWLRNTVGPTLPQTYTGVVIAKCVTIPPGADHDRVMFDSGAPAGAYSITFYKSAGAGQVVGMYAGANLFGTTVAGAWHNNQFLLKGATSKVIIDGITEATGDAGTDGLTGITIGIDHATAADGFEGDIAEALFYDHALDTTENTDLATYILTRYAI